MASSSTIRCASRALTMAGVHPVSTEFINLDTNRVLEKRDSPLNQGGERSVKAQSHVIVDLKSIKSEPSVSDRLLNSTRA